MQNHDEDVNVSPVFTEHHKKKFRDSSKDFKFIKTKNSSARHTYGNQVRSSKLKVIYLYFAVLF